MHPRRWTVPLACLALVALAVPPVATAVPPPGPSSGGGERGGGNAAYELTLVTGDRVLVTARPGRPEQVRFVPGKDSRSDSAVTTYSGGHTVVIPSAAREAVASGRVDRSLFDVTTLIAERFDDRGSAVLPVIVEYAGSPATALSRARSTALRGTAKTRVLASIGARAAVVRKGSAEAFWSSVSEGAGVERVSLDDRVRVALDRSVPQIGVPAAWQRGLTGKGVKLAVLDTGVDATHPDLAGRVVSQNFTDSPDAGDHFGHGTHVASIAAGTGAASGGRFKGVAPEATVLNGKVLSDDGSGYESWIIAGMEWAGAQGAAVANLSLGNDLGDAQDPVSQALNRVSRETGTLFVVAAGNCFFPQPMTVASPGVADDALTVGSTARDGSLSEFSCRGPRKGDGALKPEITAPGEDIVAARATGTSRGEPVDEHYTTLSGTSMATPHVSGTAALLAQSQPAWHAAQLKTRLISTADPQPGSAVSEQGAGRVDADQATAADEVSADVAELEFGVLRWPFPADDSVVRTITYSNPTSAPVTLQLAVDPGTAVPQLSATSLVVPAAGQASVTVTANRGAAGAGMFSGRITATPPAGDPVVTTFGWYAEPESYDLTVQGINRDGRPATADLAIGRPDGGPMPDLGPFGVRLQDGKATLRLPPGTYDVASVFRLQETDAVPEQWTTLASGDVELTKDTTVVLDARRGKPVDVSVQGRSGLNARERMMAYTRKSTEGLVTNGTGLSLTGVPRQLFAVPAASPAVGTAEFATGSRLEQPPFRLSVSGGSSVPVADFHFGPRFTGTKTLQVVDAGTASPAELKGKLALIKRTEDTAPGDQAYAAQQAGAAAVLFYDPAVPGMNGVASFWFYAGEELPVTIPAMRTSRTAAAGLAGKTVQVTGVAATAFTYDFVVPWNRIPASAVRTLRQPEFATVAETLGAHRAGTPSSEGRSGLTPGDAQSGGWLLPVLRTPYRRTSYVLGGHGVRWAGTVVIDQGGEVIDFGTTFRSYRAGERSAMRWLSPVNASTITRQEMFYGQGVRRLEGGLGVNISPFGKGPDVYDHGFSAPGTFQTTVSRDGTVIGSEESAGLWLDVPAQAGAYRITLDARRDTPAWRYSTAIHSVWDFRSTGADDETMPLILADLDVPQASALSQVRVGKPVDITLALRHQTGSTPSAITAATIEISYDESHWTRLPLRKTGAASFVATVNHPANQAGKAPTLRITATDSAGAKLTQQITRAYGLTH